MILGFFALLIVIVVSVNFYSNAKRRGVSRVKWVLMAPIGYLVPSILIEIIWGVVLAIFFREELQIGILESEFNIFSIILSFLGFFLGVYVLTRLAKKLYSYPQLEESN